VLGWLYDRDPLAEDTELAFLRESKSYVLAFARRTHELLLKRASSFDPRASDLSDATVVHQIRTRHVGTLI
jgi:hypothetical protein